MVFIITGPRNSGKTTRLLNIFQKKRGGGIASLKSKKDGYENYFIHFLGSAQDKVLLATENPEFENKDGFFRFKRFFFNKNAFKRSYLYVIELIALSVSPIYLDEVGELEFNGMGFHGICLKLMRLQRDVYITVRDTNISRFLDVCEPEKYKILSMEE